MRADERAALWKRIGDAGFLSDDEKRAAVGYGPAPGVASGGVERRYNPNHDPADGRFASGPGLTVGVPANSISKPNDNTSTGARHRVAFLAPYLIEQYVSRNVLLCTYQSWPGKFVVDFNRYEVEECPKRFLPGYGPVE